MPFAAKITAAAKGQTADFTAEEQDALKTVATAATKIISQSQDFTAEELANNANVLANAKGLQKVAESMGQSSITQQETVAFIKGGSSLSINILPYNGFVVTEVVIFSKEENGLRTVDKKASKNMGGQTFTFTTEALYKIGYTYKAAAYEYTGSKKLTTSKEFIYNGETTINVVVPLPSNNNAPVKNTPPKVKPKMQSEKQTTVENAINSLRLTMRSCASDVKKTLEDAVKLQVEIAEIDGATTNRLLDLGLTLGLTLIGLYPVAGDFAKDLLSLGISMIKDEINHTEKRKIFSEKIAVLQRIANLYNLSISEAENLRDKLLKINVEADDNKRAELFQFVTAYESAYIEAQKKIEAKRGVGLLPFEDIQAIILSNDYYVCQKWASMYDRSNPLKLVVVDYVFHIETLLIAPNGYPSAFTELLKPYHFSSTLNDKAVSGYFPKIRIVKSRGGAIREKPLPVANPEIIKSVYSAE